MGRVAGGSPKRRQAERRAGKRARGCLGRQRRSCRGGGPGGGGGGGGGRGGGGGGEFRCPDFLTRAPRPSRRVGPPAGRGRPEPGTEQPAAAREEHPCQRH
ncbi:unnamed protein product [Prorocentrum cordatum]|uniref:Uncharacterized protein n=1 Tax=Prorocentrum cordatum TaxID=2364126 RepID=A0ABN9Y2H0_9DINO|nr:unnamed protein product [Polarella glacialis]